MEGVLKQPSRNHRHDGFFHRPDRQVQCLYCFFVIAHDRRRALHFNVTKLPSSFWTVPQLREAIPYEHRCKCLIFDRDAKTEMKCL
jgi:putative transposase